MSEQTGEMTQADIAEVEVEYSYGEHPDQDDQMGILIQNTKFEDFFISFKYIKPNIDQETETASLAFEYDVIGLPEGHDPKDYENNNELHQVVGKIAMDEFIKSLEAKARADQLSVEAASALEDAANVEAAAL